VRQSNPVNIFLICSLKYFKIIHPTTTRSHNKSLPQRFPNQNVLCIFSLTQLSSCPLYLILDLITITIRGDEYKLWCASLSIFPNYPVASSLLGQNNPFSTWFPTPSILRSATRLGGKPYKHRICNKKPLKVQKIIY
jgi:hypothetical protein